jgi:hypothetical protein
MAEERRHGSVSTILLAGVIVLAGAILFCALVPAFRCPACAPWEPGYVMTVTHTGQCEFCIGEDRLTLLRWYKARDWRSQAMMKDE